MNGGLLHIQAQMGLYKLFETGTMSVQDLNELNKALRDSGVDFLAKASAGYPQQGVDFSGDFAPLIPQSIQMVADVASFVLEDLTLWPLLSKQDVNSTLYESVVVEEYGNRHLDPWFDEGKAGVTSSATYKRQTVKVKYLQSQRKITDVATTVGILGAGIVSKRGLQTETEAGTMDLLEKIERALFWGDSAMSPLAFDGIYKAVGETSAEIEDMRGKELTIPKLITKIAEKTEDPFFARPNCALTTPRVYSTLKNQAIVYNRGDLNSRPPQNDLVFDGRLRLIGDRGEVEIKSCPILMEVQKPNTAAIGDNAPLAAVASAAVAGTDGKFIASEEGTYQYKVVAIGDKGVATPTTVANVAILAGQKVTFTITDAGLATGSANAGIRYYRLYRSKVGGAAADVKYLWKFARNTNEAANTTFVDDNRHMIDTAPFFLLELNKKTMHWVQLLDMIRRPLAQVDTSIPFLCMAFGSPQWKLPKRQFVFDNCATSS